MGSKTYKESSLEKCLSKAASELNIKEEELDYEVTEEKKGLFKSYVVILVNIPEKSEKKEKKVNLLSGTVKIENGKIIIKDPSPGNRAATLLPSKNLSFIVNGEVINKETEVFSDSIIEYSFEANTAQRRLFIQTSEDKLEAFVTINYFPEIEFEISASEEVNVLKPEVIIKDKKFPPHFTEEEIREELKKNSIVYGIINENVKNCTKLDEVEKLKIAEGIPVCNDENDLLDIKVSLAGGEKNFNVDENGKIDFKSIGFVNAVKKDDVIAILIKGKQGNDGKDILGNNLKRKAGKVVSLKVGEGCQIKNETTVIATEEGKPCIKSGKLCVYKVHKVESDVDIKSGNIKFIGDLEIYGSVREGMKVEAGNKISITKGVEQAHVIAGGDIEILGNIIASEVIAGGEDVRNLKQIDNVTRLKNQLTSLMETVEQIKKFNLLGYEASDGEIIKVLIENKFKLIPRNCFEIIVSIDKERGKTEENLIELIKSKLLGIAPISIKHYGELQDIIVSADENLELLQSSLAIPVNVKISYCQDSKIKSSGDIHFTGKGEYVSHIESNGSIYFDNPQGVARGGEITAKDLIKCTNVGSAGGVSTKLQVGEHGQIYADIVYQNTIFIVGLRKYCLEKASKNVKVYINESGDLEVECLRL